MVANTKTTCRAMTKNGRPCRAAAMEGGLCFFHANPLRAAELGRLGGLTNRRIATDIPSLPILATAQGVKEAVAQLITDVYSKKIPPRIASGLAPLLSLQLRAIETSDLERRLRALEGRPSQAEVAKDTSVNGGAEEKH